MSHGTDENDEVNEKVIEDEGKNLTTKFTTIFELGSNHKCGINVSRPSTDDLNSSTLAQIAEYVASTGELLNISDLRNWLETNPDQGGIHDDIVGVKTILCMPIWNGKRNVIGVAQLINKVRALVRTHKVDSDLKMYFKYRKTI